MNGNSEQQFLASMWNDLESIKESWETISKNNEIGDESLIICLALVGVQSRIRDRIYAVENRGEKEHAK